MPTSEQLQAELERLKRERDSKKRLYDQAQKVASNSTDSLKEAETKYKATLQKAKTQSQKDADLAMTAATSSTMTQDQKDAAMKVVKGNMESTAQSLSEAISNVQISIDVSKSFQKDLDAAKKNLDKANTDYANKQAQLVAQQAAESQKIATEAQQQQNQALDKTAGQIDAQIAEFKKSATGLNDYNPDVGCQNITAPCTECADSVSAAQQACKGYGDAKIAYERAKQNTVKVAQDESSNQAKLSADIRDFSNQIAAYNKTISAGISVLKDMARDGSTQAQKDGLSKHIKEQQVMVDTMRIVIKNIEVEIGNSQKAIENAKAAEQTAQDNVQQKKNGARLALAELASCSLKCQKKNVNTTISSSSTDSKTTPQGSAEVSGGSINPIGTSAAKGESTPTNGTTSASNISSTSNISTPTFEIGTGYNTDGTLAWWDESSLLIWMVDHPYSSRTSDYIHAFPNSAFTRQWLIDHPTKNDRIWAGLA